MRPNIILEKYFDINEFISVDCITNICSHFNTCCQIRTEFFCYNDRKIDFLFIGQGGGEEEEKTLRPFIGDAGQRLRSIIEWILLDGYKFSVAFSNSVRCRPIKPNITPPKNRDPYPDEVSVCRKYVERDILKLKPRFVVPLGNSSTKFFIPEAKGKISEDHGKIFNIKIGELDQQIMPTFHPSFLIRNGKTFKKDNPGKYDCYVREDLINALSD